jgi:hypothetical protein
MWWNRNNGEELKGQSSEILILFLTYIDRARPEYEPLLILKFFRGPHGFRCPDWPKTMLETHCYCYKTVLETYF